jgi:uncharacterized surface protein with fasciclin (FAS1) repeats
MKNYILICLLAILFWGCRKEGFTPPPQGEKIPYADTLKVSLKEALQQSTAQRFYKAWQRSHLPHILDSLNDGKTMFTILAPSDAALENGGYTAAGLQTMDIRELDSLLMFYVLRQRISKEDLSNRSDDLLALSLLNKPGVRMMPLPHAGPGYVYSSKYYYRHYLQIMNGKMMVNGKAVGTGVSIPAKDGYIWLLDQVIPRPQKNVLEIITADGRFTLLLGILRETRRVFGEIHFETFGVLPEGYEDPLSNDFFYTYRWIVEPPQPFSSEIDPNITFSTFFLPDDDAFRAAGFNSVADLMAFNRRRGLPYFDFDSYNWKGSFATNDLLDYHLNWGLLANQRNSPFPTNSIVFYNHMLNSSTVANYPVLGTLLDPNDPAGDPAYYMPYRFTRNASGQTQMQVKDTSAPVATIVDADINTLMGPIHVVNRLLIPKGFKID